MRIYLSYSSSPSFKDGIANYTERLIYELNALPDIQTLSSNQIPCLAHSKFDLPTSFLYSLISNKCLPKYAELKNKIDIYHATNYFIPKFKDIPVIATLHDAVPLQNPTWVRYNLRFLKNYLMKASSKWITHTIALSQAVVPDLVKYWKIEEEKISVVHSGVSENWFDKATEEEKREILRKYKLSPGYFLFVGTLQPRKNVERIIDAYTSLPMEIKKLHSLVIVGRNGWNTEALIPKINSLSADGFCSWLDYVPAEDLNALYQSAGAFVFPSLYEGFGLPILEAFASQIPVITSNTSAMPEVAGDAALLVDPYSEKEISDAMLRITEDANLRANLVTLGNARAKDMTWKKCAVNTLKVYQKNL